MKMILATMVFALGSSAFAAGKTYELNVNISMNGKHIASPKITTKEGETASVISEENGQRTFMDVVATESHFKGKKAVQMNFVVGTLGPNGEKTIQSTPKIITLLNEKAEITQGATPGEEDLKISVTPKQVTN